jgi:nucleoside-diphosphate-sugar epimerase
MKVLFLGGAGNLSTACAREGLEQGHSVAILTRRTRPADPAAEWVRGDARDRSALEALAARRFDAVVQFVGFEAADVRRDVEAFEGRCGQYVFISSASAYLKPPPHYLVTEKTPLGNPFWEYSRKKIEAEELLRSVHSAELPVTIVRPSYTYGETWIPTTWGTDYTVVKRLREGREIVVPGDGTSLWVLTHASDLARGVVGLLGQPQALGEAFHVTSDEVLTWNQIYETIARAVSAEPRLVHVPSDFVARVDPGRGPGLLGDKSWSLVFDNSKVRGVVPGFRARVPFEQGVRASIDWFEEDPSRQRTDAEGAIERILAAWKRAMAAVGGG